jgi:uncharacterized lipoprotein
MLYALRYNVQDYNMRILPVSLSLALLSGCGLMPDRSLEYQQAKTLPPLVLSTGDSRVIKPLYAIPEIATPEQPVVLVEGKGRKQRFVAPLPKPLTVVAQQVESSSTPIVETKPQIVNDGNGHPVLQSSGDILQVWDKLNKALTAANIKVSDRNQSLGLYFVELSKDGKNTIYQLKLIRTSNDNVISLQKDDETLVESELSQQTFERLLNHWPS